MSNTLYTWTFSDEKNRGKLWYIIAFSFVIGLAIWGFLTKQYGMSFIVLLIAGLSFFIENNSEENVTIEIKDAGIKISESFYDYGKIQGFHFVYQGENARFLRLILKKQGIKVISLKIDDNIAADLQNILPGFIEESEKTDLSFSEKLIAILKL